MSNRGRKRIEDHAIGRRAAAEVIARCDAHGYSYDAETRAIGVGYGQLRKWDTGRVNPSVIALARMAAHGYDVMYILLGERTVRT